MQFTQSRLFRRGADSVPAKGKAGKVSFSPLLKGRKSNLSFAPPQLVVIFHLVVFLLHGFRFYYEVLTGPEGLDRTGPELQKPFGYLAYRFLLSAFVGTHNLGNETELLPYRAARTGSIE